LEVFASAGAASADDVGSVGVDLADEAGTDCLAEISLDPLSGLGGFEEEHRLWWQFGRPDRVTAARGPERNVAKAGD
jgi:hypothetical protein